MKGMQKQKRIQVRRIKRRLGEATTPERMDTLSRFVTLTSQVLQLTPPPRRLSSRITIMRRRNGRLNNEEGFFLSSFEQFGYSNDCVLGVVS